MITVAHFDQSGSRTDYLARGGSSISQRDYLSRGGTQTLGSSVRVENMTALRSTPQWLTATSKLPPSVGITVIYWVSLYVTMTSGHCADSQADGIMFMGFVFPG